MRRGDIRAALLTGLLEGPAHGYELIRRLETGSQGTWRPSAGSVYPTLQLLEEEGLLASREEAGKRVYELTDAGRTEAETHATGPRPWEGEAEGSAGDLRRAVEALVMAARQVDTAGDHTTVERAAAIVTGARKELYRLLAES